MSYYHNYPSLELLRDFIISWVASYRIATFVSVLEKKEETGPQRATIRLPPILFTHSELSMLSLYDNQYQLNKKKGFKKMEKYYVAGTDEELQFGDVVEITLVKEDEESSVTVVKQVTFSEDAVEWLLELGYVEAHDEEDDEEDEPCDILQDLLADFETLEKRVDRVEDVVKAVGETVKTISKVVADTNKACFEFTQLFQNTINDLKNKQTQAKKNERKNS